MMHHKLCRPFWMYSAFRFFQYLQGFLVWLTVEITCNDGWHIRSYLFDFVQEESYTFLAGYLAVIVQVSVEIHKFLSVAFSCNTAQVVTRL